MNEFLMALPVEQHAAIAEAMALVRQNGHLAGGARKLRGRIWEIRVDNGEVIHRIAFASVGERGRVLLSLDVFVKKTQKTPPSRLRLAV